MTTQNEDNKKNLVRLCGQPPANYQWSSKNLCGNMVVGLPEYSPPLPQQLVTIQPNLLVGIPTGISNDFEWTRDFAVKFVTRMCPPNSGLIFENRYGIAQARESLANQFIQN